MSHHTEVQILRYRRGGELVNPLRQPPLRQIEIRLVFPPHSTDQISERPAAKMRYVLLVAGWELQGFTDAAGYLREKVPAIAKTGQLQLWPKEQRYDIAQPLWTVEIRFMVLPSSF